MTQHYFAITQPGLEHALWEELGAIHVRKRVQLEGGVEFEATHRGFYEVMHRSWFTNRLYLRVAQFRSRDVHELYRKSRRFEWERLLPPGCLLEIHATTQLSRMTGTGQIADTVGAAIRDHFVQDLALPPPVQATSQDAAIHLYVRLHDNSCTFNLDAGGQPMYQRGWRGQTGVAPLRETTASAILRLLGWQPGVPLLDPMCGSGTFLIEAARYSRGLPPRVWESYAFHRWANFQPDVWQRVVEESAESCPTSPMFWGFDSDPVILRKAEQNAQTADVHEMISFRQQDISKLSPSPVSSVGMIVANPPYGLRLKRPESSHPSPEQTLLSRAFSSCPGWTVGLLLPSRMTPSHPSLSLEVIAKFRNGGQPVRLWRTRVPT